MSELDVSIDDLKDDYEAGRPAPPGPPHGSRCPTCLKMDDDKRRVTSWPAIYYECPDGHQWTVVRATGDLRYWSGDDARIIHTKKGWTAPESRLKFIKTRWA